MKAVFFLIAFFALGLMSVGAVDTLRASAIRRADGSFSVVPYFHANALVRGVYTPSVPLKGYSQLTVVASHGESYDRFYCAGLVEGYLMASEIENHFRTWHQGVMSDFQSSVWPPAAVQKYFDENLSYMLHNGVAKADMKVWAMHNLTLSQLYGLHEGFLRGNGSTSIQFRDIYLMNANGDFDGLASILQPSLVRDHDWFDTHHHCSGLVRLINGELFIAQDTWSSFSDLYRTAKTYYLNAFQGSATWVSVSTSPGIITSTDDFAKSSTGITYIETTNNIFNASMWKECHSNQVLSFFRTNSAMHLANDNLRFSELLMYENSGTYTNSYLHIDYKRFKPFETVQDNLLYMTEILTGNHMVGRDITEDMLMLGRSGDATGWFPSINVPYTRTLFDVAGYPEEIAKLGDKGSYWSYYNSSRWHIFVEQAPQIETYDQFKKLMRYNNWKHDPNSNGDPAQAIMSRYDQRPSSCTWGTAHAFGGLDTKVTRYADAFKPGFDFIVSPTVTDEIPPWEFGVPPFEDVLYYGLPKKFDFDWTFYSPSSDVDSMVEFDDSLSPLFE